MEFFESTILAARHYYRGGNGLEDLGVIFFATRGDFEKTQASLPFQRLGKDAWYTDPISVDVVLFGFPNGDIERYIREKRVWVNQKDLAKLNQFH